MTTTAARTGYLTSYTATFQIEGVDRATAAVIAAKVQYELERAFSELVREESEAGPDRKISTRVEAQQHVPEEYDAR